MRSGQAVAVDVTRGGAREIDALQLPLLRNPHAAIATGFEMMESRSPDDVRLPAIVLKAAAREVQATNGLLFQCIMYRPVLAIAGHEASG